MRVFKTVLLAAGFSLATACAAWSAEGMSSYLQSVGKDRHRVVKLQGRTAERFELRGGDCNWDKDGRNSKDCWSGRERVEHRSLTYDELDKAVCYSYGLYLPSDYAEMRPKSMLGQWHNDRKGDAISLRYMQGRMWLSHNINSHEVRDITIPFSKGRWNDFTFRIRPSRTSGEIKVWHNGRLVVNVARTRIVSGSVSRLYFKYGIYRSKMRGVMNRPTQVAYYSGVRRFSGKRCDGL